MTNDFSFRKPPVGMPLSPREAEIFSLIVEGNPAKKVAKLTNLSVHTVQSHASRVRCKLGAKNLVQAAAIYTAKKIKEQI